MGKKHRVPLYKNFDFFLLALVIMASIFGLILIYSATISSGNNLKTMVVQSGALVLGVAAIFIVATIDYEHLAGLWKYIYIVNIGLLVLVLVIGEGDVSWGGKSWIRFAGIGIQPAEIVKILFTVTFSAHLYTLKDNLNHPKNILLALVHLGVLVGLIHLQPDDGTAMVFIFMALGMLFSYGISYWYLVASLSALCISLPIVWNFMAYHQKNRILVFLNPALDPQGEGYHVLQSKIAIGSGQIFGKGFLKGTQTQLNYLPTKHTDFIFAVLGEEFGLIGSTLLVILLIAIILRCLHSAAAARNELGASICVGVACMFIFQTFENIGMCMGLTPVTGIPLPFISYGGSALLTNLTAIGLVLSVTMRRKTINF